MKHTIIHHLVLIFRSVIKGIILLPFWTVITILGLFFWDQTNSPWNLILGLPTIALGLTMGLGVFYEMVVGIISPRWRKTNCPLCEPPKEVKKVLFPHNGFAER